MGSAVRREGFSLIEALVALAIAALSFVAIFELQDQMSRGQARLNRVLETSAIERNALELIHDVNFMAEPEGERLLAGGRVVRWTTTPLTPVRRSITLSGADGLFDVALYRVDADIMAPGGRRIGGLSLRRMGWVRVYAAESDAVI